MTLRLVTGGLRQPHMEEAPIADPFAGSIIYPMIALSLAACFLPFAPLLLWEAMRRK